MSTIVYGLVELGPEEEHDTLQSVTDRGATSSTSITLTNELFLNNTEDLISMKRTNGGEEWGLKIIEENAKENLVIYNDNYNLMSFEEGDPASKVGIGTNNPESELHVMRNSDDGTRIKVTNNYSGVSASAGFTATSEGGPGLSLSTYSSQHSNSELQNRSVFMGGAWSTGLNLISYRLFSDIKFHVWGWDEDDVMMMITRGRVIVNNSLFVNDTEVCTALNGFCNVTAIPDTNFTTECGNGEVGLGDGFCVDLNATIDDRDESGGASSVSDVWVNTTGDTMTGDLNVNAPINSSDLIYENTSIERFKTPSDYKLVYGSHLNENANDMTGNGNDGTTTLGATFGDYNSFCKSGACAILDGTGKISLGNSLLDGSTRWTIAEWHYFNNTGSDTLFIGDLGVGSYPLCRLTASQNGVARCYIHAGGGWKLNYLSSATVFQNSTWYHLAINYDGDKVYFYVNGIIDAVTDVANDFSLDATQPAYIGGDGGSAPYTLGLIDEVYIWNRSLSHEEIRQIYLLKTPINIETNDYLARKPVISFNTDSVTETALKTFVSSWDFRLRSDYDNTLLQPGILMYTSGDPNQGSPKAGIWMNVTSVGAYMHFGVSGSYINGINNVPLTLDPTGIGKVGIGMSRPETQLHVKGPHVSGQGMGYFDGTDDSNAFIVLDANTGSDAGFILREKSVSMWDLTYDAGGNYFMIYDDVNNFPAIVIEDGTRDVGIGLLNPTVPLEVSDAGNDIFAIDRTGAYAVKWTLGSADKDLRFNDGSVALVSKFTITDEGSACVQEETCLEEFSVHDTDGTAYMAIHDTRSTAGDNVGIKFGTYTGYLKTMISHVETGGYGTGDIVFSLDSSAVQRDVNIVQDEKFRFTSTGEFRTNGTMGDGTGKALCIKADGYIGTCTDAVGAGGTCTCA